MKYFRSLLGVFILAIVIFKVINLTSQAQELNLSEEDYRNGTKRFQAVKKKVTPSLKTAFTEKDLTWGSPIYLRAFKEEKTLELWVQKGETFTLFRSYHIAAASGKLGPKLREGDRQVPEGFYYVSRGRMNPQSNFHLAFNIGYPNSYDKTHGRTGSFIMVHGSNVSIGCLAMTDAKIEEIYTLADAAFTDGQDFFRIHIFPYRMTSDNNARHKSNKWSQFWTNLQTGYDWFEEKKTPPNVTVKKQKYHFE